MQPAKSSPASSTQASASERPLAGDGWTASGDGIECPRWYAVVSSRLGRSVENRRRWFELLQRTVQRAVAEDAALLVVAGTAPEPWVVRAAELFHAKTIRLEVADPEHRDRVLVELAERLFVLRARRGGRIERLVAERIAAERAAESAIPSTSVYVAVHDDPDDAGASLVARGGIGWWLMEPLPDHSAGLQLELAPSLDMWPQDLTRPQAAAEEIAESDAWLVHCTRARSGRGDGQSEAQWRDEVLLGGEGGRARSPLQVLERILREGRLRGGATVTATPPVVCFSAVPLAELLARRTYRSHLGRWDYEPYGIAIRRSKLLALGGQPVVYGDTFDGTGLSEAERWRFQASGKTFDWQQEREWRVEGSLDLRQLDDSDAVVFVQGERAARQLSRISRWPVAVIDLAAPHAGIGVPWSEKHDFAYNSDRDSVASKTSQGNGQLSVVTQSEGLHPLKPYKSLENEVLQARIEAVRQELGDRLLILGHHYQQDEVIAHCDLRGDSYQLSQMAAESESCEAIVFCGVHFMAETADLLANRPEKSAQRDGVRIPVVLPDMAAGCSMADMAGINQVEAAWEDMGEVIDTSQVIPVTYINSAASLKAFCGRHGGIVCTSSNAAAVLEWAFERGQRVFFFPDQHLGRNTALKMGIGVDQMPVWDPYQLELGGNTEAFLEKSKVILWKGHCSVHQMFRPEHVAQFRQQHPGIKILVHPECPREVNDLADVSGSTGKIIKTVEESPPGSKWAIGTELHLVNRLKQEHPEQEIHFLSPVVCMCATMYRIDLPHLCWSLENLRDGHPVNVIEVEPEVTKWALIALERMLAVR